jgi:hypothetical protein
LARGFFYYLAGVKINAYIFTCNRPAKVAALVTATREAWPDSRIVVIDDATTDLPKLPEADRVLSNRERGGKQRFWRQWQQAFGDACLNDADIYLFMPDDDADVNYSEIARLGQLLNGTGYIFGTRNDGRIREWGSHPWHRAELEDGTPVFRSYFNDCALFCDAVALDLLNYEIHPIPPSRWANNPNISSGVGQQLTNRINQLGITCYHPITSLCHHVYDVSVMHPDERKKNPLTTV